MLKNFFRETRTFNLLFPYLCAIYIIGMARIELHNGVTLKGARRILTRRGSSFRLTLRHGRLYTFRKFHCQQPNSPAQIRCRNLLVEATRLAKADMARPGRLDFWTLRAASTGYKTAIGCARAFFIAQLKANSSLAADSVHDDVPARRVPLTISSHSHPVSAANSSSSSDDVVHIWRSADWLRSTAHAKRRKNKTPRY